MKQSLIKNYKSLAVSPLRKDALKILESGMKAIETRNVVKKNIFLKGNTLYVNRKKYDLNKYHEIFVIGIGKSSFEVGKELENILGDRITTGIILDVKVGNLKKIKTVAGSHPLPSMKNMKATGEIIGILKNVDSKDLVIAIISGGGSSLLCWPFQLKCDEYSKVINLLMKKGADIHEINTVRKHLSEIKGGQFSRLAYPAEVIGLIFSDVLGNDLSMIASGPTVLDGTTIEDASQILLKYDVMKACKLPECELNETPKDPVYFKKVRNHLILTNQIALKAMFEESKKLDYKVRIYSDVLSGEARDVGKKFARIPKKGEAILAAGETTVTVRGKGKGGRNQEFALGALPFISDDSLVLSYASDGIDNCDYAGGISDIITKKRADLKNLNIQNYLQKNDSCEFFKKVRSYIKTGITGVNISDLMIAIKER